jgi:hypothetical protein
MAKKNSHYLNDDPIILFVEEEVHISSHLAKLMLDKIIEGINNTRYYRQEAYPHVNISWAQRTIDDIKEIKKWVNVQIRDSEFQELRYEFTKIKSELRYYIMEEGKRARREDNLADNILNNKTDTACPFCGTYLDPKSKFCKTCGTELLGYFSFLN